MLARKSFSIKDLPPYTPPILTAYRLFPGFRPKSNHGAGNPLPPLRVANLAVCKTLALRAALSTSLYALAL